MRADVAMEMLMGMKGDRRALMENDADDDFDGDVNGDEKRGWGGPHW